MAFIFFVPNALESAGGIGMSYAQGLASGLRAMAIAATVKVLDDLTCGPDYERPLEGANRPVIDGLSIPHFLPQIEQLAERRAVAIMHHTASRARDSVHSRNTAVEILRVMLPCFARIIATSETVAHSLVQDFAVSQDTISVVQPGAGEYSRGVPPASPCHILSTGVLTRRKRYDVLIRTLSPLQDLDWHLTIAGESSRDPDCATELEALARDAGGKDRITLLANPSPAALETAWGRTSLFASMTRWEGYPAATAQALRRGIPILVTEAAAALMIQGAGIALPDDDEPTASKVFRRAIFDGRMRTAMAETAWQAGLALPGWNAQARLFAAVLEDGI